MDPRHTDRAFSARASAALAHSRDEAVRLGHDALGPEHLLLGLLREGGPPARALRALGVNTQQLARAAEAAAPPPIVEPGEPWQGEMGMTAEAVAALERAEQAAASGDIEAEHMLLGLVGDEEGVAVRALRTFGVTAEAVRGEVRRLRGETVIGKAAVEKVDEPGTAAERERARAASAGQRLSLVFDGTATEEEVAALLLALSELYRALGGDGLVILDSGVPSWDPEGGP